MLVSIASVLVGLVLLAYAADQFVLGAARLALLRRVPPLVVGIVVIGFGTSAPELLVSTIAAASDEVEVAIGNVVGSNIANLTLLLGVGAAITPLVVAGSTIRREAPMALGAVVLYAVLVQNGFTTLEGVVLLVAAVVVLSAIVGPALRNTDDPMGEETVELSGDGDSLGAAAVRTLLGLIGTVGGAQLLLVGATDIADRAGLSSGVVGATLVAIGTSLPELVTVIQSARRQESDLLVGNLLGSNLFNALVVGGVAAVVGPAVVDANELTVIAAIGAVIATLIAGASMWTGHRLVRSEGLVLIASYAVFTIVIGTG